MSNNEFKLIRIALVFLALGMILTSAVFWLQRAEIRELRANQQNQIELNESQGKLNESIVEVLKDHRKELDALR